MNSHDEGPSPHASQLRFRVYSAGPLYATSVAKLTGIPLERDSVFAGNTAEQVTAMTPRLTGDGASGFQAAVTIGITTA